jgi:hypothetical protein
MKILLAWEMGRNYGHVTKLAELAKAIARKQKKRVELIFVLQSTGALLQFADGLDYKLLQAPLYPPRPRPRPPAVKGKAPAPPAMIPSLTYVDDLRACGYEDPKALAGLIRSWRDLYDLVKPDILITQAAPTALLAARGFKFKTVTYGGTYDIPASANPMPLVCYWEKYDPKIIAVRESEIVRNVNEALALNGLKPIASMSEMLKTDRQFITMFEELDHYPDRARIEGKKPHYLGQCFSLDSGEDIAWNKKAQKRIMAYIRPESPAFAQAITALSKSPKNVDVIISAPGISEPHRKALQQLHVRVINGPVRLAPLLKDCDLGINHSSQGIACAFAVHGIPQLLLPGHIEQLGFAKALGRNTLGRSLVGRFGPDKVHELIGLLLHAPEYKASAQAFAQKYNGFKPEKLADDVAEKIIALANAKGKK